MEKYKVADGVTLTAKGVIYKAGDVLPEDILSDESAKKQLLAAKKIVSDKDKGEAKAESKKDEGKKAEKPEAEKPAKSKAEK